MSKPVLILAVSLAFLASTASANPEAIVTCNAEKIKEAMSACDSVVNISQIKCDTTACHKALHLLVEDEYISCYEELKLGSKSDLTKYKKLDDFCHGEGPDPLEEGVGASGNSTTTGSSATDKNEQSVTTAPSTVPAPTSAPTTTPSSGAASLACGATVVVLAVGVASLV